MKIQYANESIINMILGDPTTCVYKLVYDENYSNDINVLQYFNMHGLVLYIKIDSFVAHMLYAWSFSHNI